MLHHSLTSNLYISLYSFCHFVILARILKHCTLTLSFREILGLLIDSDLLEVYYQYRTSTAHGGVLNLTRESRRTHDSDEGSRITLLGRIRTVMSFEMPKFNLAVHDIYLLFLSGALDAILDRLPGSPPGHLLEPA